ncbi:MAG: D-alanine--D-alanine ligase [Acidobacteria bacterium]|nr:D-alanine--D-alanine ligase [Acidobacteriota bacterium]
MARKLRLGILFGGRSGEHEISLRSAQNIIAAADFRKYTVIPIGITKQGQWRVGTPLEVADTRLALNAILQRGMEVALAVSPHARFPLIPLQGSMAASRLGKLDVIFPVLHGTFGEDGTVQGLLELAGIPYVGAGVLGSAVGMDKDVMKRLFRERGLEIVPHLVVRRADLEASSRKVFLAIEKKLRYPVFVKPANLGSSVGISKARNRKELGAALRIAAEYDRKILVERAVEGREMECSVLGNDAPLASVPGEIIPGREFYDYAAKYLEDTAQLLVPAPLRPAQVKQVQRLAIEAFNATECAGMARVDFFLERKTGKIYVNEINTIPGFTSISMYPRMWEASGLPYSRLIDRLIELALELHREKTRTRYSFQPSTTKEKRR